jgi:galactose mutarotase-like enzyme
MPSPPELRSHRSVTLAVGDVELDVDLDAGARATRWDVGRHSLLIAHGPHPFEHGMYPMGPWAGRLRDNAVVFRGVRHDLPVNYGDWAMHGTLALEPAAVLDHEEGRDVARLVARIDEHPGWPWPMAVDIEWELRERCLTTTITVTAHEDEMPVVLGWHPWFRRRLDVGGPLEWTLAATTRAERGEDYLPTGRLLPFDPAEGPFDDAFEVPSGCATVRWPGALAVEISSSAGWFVVFDQLPSSACIEPQSGPPNGVNDGLGSPVQLAVPGRPLRLVTTWTILDEPQGDPD